MTSIWGYGCFHRERNSKGLSRSLSPPEFNYNKSLIDSVIVNPVVNLFGSFINKYIEEDLQGIFRTVLKTQLSLFNRPHKKLLKARLRDIYCSNFYIECYNLC